MNPAVVRFVGNEQQYVLSCDETEVRYCHLCDRFQQCRKKENRPTQFTVGEQYHARVVEYWEGERNGLEVEDNQRNGYSSFIPFEDFEIVSDPDDVLNAYEATVRCIYPGYDGEDYDLYTDKVYKAIGRDKNGYYLVMDESGCCYFYPAHEFEIVSDPHGILCRESLCCQYFDQNSSST